MLLWLKPTGLAIITSVILSAGKTITTIIAGIIIMANTKGIINTIITKVTAMMINHHHKNY